MLRSIALGGAGLGTAAILGCGGDDDDDGSASSPEATAGSSTPGSTPQAGGSPAASAITRGGTLIVGTNADLTTFDPHIGLAGGDSNYTYNVFDALVAYDREVRPDANLSLAESWEQPDDTTIVFHLREAMFHDDTPVDAEAIKWNIDRILDPATQATNQSQFEVLTSVEAQDSRTVVFKLSQVAADMLTTLGSRASLIVSPTAFEELGDDFLSNPVGSGPFRVERRTVGDRVVFRANETYWRQGADGSPLPYLEGIEVRFIQDPTARVAALLAGDIHVDVDIAPKDLSRVRDNDAYQTVTLEGSTISHTMQYNYALAPMDDLNLRLAIEHAINPQDIVDGAYLGEATVAKGGYWPPTLWVYEDIPDKAMFDLERAKQLVADSVYDGETIMLSTWNRPDVTQTAQIVQEHLDRAGIRTEIVTGDVGQMTARFFREGEFALFNSPFGLYPEPNHIAQNVFSSRGAQNAGALNGGGQDEDIDLLVDQGRETYDLDERREIYTELNRLVMARAKPLFPTVYGRSTRAAVKEVGNFEEAALNGDSWFRFAAVHLG